MKPKQTRMVTAATTLLFGVSLGLTACTPSVPTAPETTESVEPTATASTEAPVTVKDPLAVTHEAGIYLLDPETLEVYKDVPLSGITSLNPAGDGEHILVATATEFLVLDVINGKFIERTFEADVPGRVMLHGGRTSLFADGSGEITVFDPHQLTSDQSKIEVIETDEPHHGVALTLKNSQLVHTTDDLDARAGIVVLGQDRKEVLRNEECPEVSGGAVAKSEAAVFGCRNGVLIYAKGEISKVFSPRNYGRISVQAGSDKSAVVLGDYQIDRNTELERPEKFSLTDTAEKTLTIVDLPQGISYSPRSLARGPSGEVLLLTTDGQLRVIDPDNGELVQEIAVLEEPWEEPLTAQESRPTIFVRGGTAYVSDPETLQIHAIDIAKGEIIKSVKLEDTPNYISGVVHNH